MSVLREAPFLLAQGAEVIARVGATNLIDTSDFSAESSNYDTYAVVQDVPSMPTQGPERGELTTTD